MRREYLTLAAAFGAIAVIMASVALQPQIGQVARHADPAQAVSETPSPAALALIYSSVFGNISSGEFEEAYRSLGSLEGVYVPENAKYIFSRFNQLISQEALELESADARIAGALRSLSLGLIETAKANVSSALLSLAKASITSSSLSSAASEFAKTLRTRQLTPEIAMVEGAIASYYGDLDEIMRSIGEVEAGNVTATAIDLSLSGSHVIIGDNVSATGRLTELSSGAPLPGREVAVLACGRAYLAETDADGRFEIQFEAAAPGGPQQSVSAAFLYDGSHAGSYASAPIVVNYIVPKITATADRSRALPGDAVRLSLVADLSEWAAPVAPELREEFGARLSGALQATTFRFAVTAFGSEEVVGSGYPVGAMISVSVPAGAASGSHPINAALLPASMFAGSAASASVEVYRKAVEVSLSAPSIALGGTYLTMYGSASSSGSAVAGASVSASFAGATASATTGQDGSFSVTITVPPWRASGWESARAVVQPADYRLSASSASATVLVVSPMMAVVAAAGAVAAFGLARRAASGGKATGSLVYAAAAQAKQSQLPPAETLAGIYARAAQAVGAALGTFARESETVREYLARVASRLGALGKAFGELTLMLEESLYGMKEVDASRGRSLLSLIIERLGIALGSAKSDAKEAEGGEKR